MTLLVMMDRPQARELTERIQVATESLAAMLLEAHERQAWRALGYKSWMAYIDGEFDFKRGRAYQLLDQARADAQLSEVVGAPVSVSERTLRPVKGSMAEIMAQAERNVASGMAPQPAADEAVKFVRQRVAVERSYEDFSDSQDEVPVREQRSDELTTLVETARAVLPYVNDGAAEWALRSALEPFA